MADERTRRLCPGETLDLASGTRLMCCAGVVELDGHVMRAGDSKTVTGAARVIALEGMRDEWLGESGIVVLLLGDG